MQGPFDEHIKIMSALRDNYVRSDDASCVARIAQERSEIEQACSRKEANIASVIKGVSRATRR